MNERKIVDNARKKIKKYAHEKPISFLCIFIGIFLFIMFLVCMAEPPAKPLTPEQIRFGQQGMNLGDAFNYLVNEFKMPPFMWIIIFAGLWFTKWF